MFAREFPICRPFVDCESGIPVIHTNPATTRAPLDPTYRPPMGYNTTLFMIQAPEAQEGDDRDAMVEDEKPFILRTEWLASDTVLVQAFTVPSSLDNDDDDRSIFSVGNAVNLLSAHRSIRVAIHPKHPFVFMLSAECATVVMIHMNLDIVRARSTTAHPELGLPPYSLQHEERTRRWNRQLYEIRTKGTLPVDQDDTVLLWSSSI